MPGFVKTPAGEKRWAKAKRAARHAGMKGSHFWAFANSFWHGKMKHRGKK